METWGWILLGNPGAAYARTRHNLGRIVGEALAALQGWDWKNDQRGRAAQGSVGAPPDTSTIRVFSPNSYMNASGETSVPWLKFYRIPPERTLVFHDELELPALEWSIRKGGGLGGHNGLRSLEKHWGTRDFYRLRLGIGRPDRTPPASWVLQPLPTDQIIAWDSNCPAILNSIRSLP